MKFNNLLRFPFSASVLVLFLVLAAGCGGDSGEPVYSGSSIYLDERDGQPVLVYEISISDGAGDPYSEGLLVQGTAFTPDSSFPIVAANQAGKVIIVLEASTAGDYRVAIDSFTDTEGRSFLPSPDNQDLNGKVLLTHNYAP